MDSGGMLRTSEAIRLGIHPRTLYMMRDEGLIVQVSRGLFRLAHLDSLSEPDLVTIAYKVPRAVICLISALSYHDITTEIPHEVHVALPRDVKAPRLDHPPIRVFRFSGESLKEGIEEHRVDSITVKIYSPEKTVADCFKFRGKVGNDVAIEALKDYIQLPGADIEELLRFARINRVEQIMRPYLEAVTS